MVRYSSILLFSLLAFIVVINTACSVVAESPAIATFQECVDAGNKVLRSYPARCVTSDGRTFTEPVAADALPHLDLKDSKKLCVNRCGDGACDMMVCMGEGCPCAESSQSCPKDCQ